MNSSIDYTILFYGGLIFIVFFSIFLGALKDTMKFKKKLIEIKQYIDGERNRLLQEKYQGFIYKYSYSGDLEKEEKTKYQNYLLTLEKNIDKYEVQIINRIVGKEVSERDTNHGSHRYGDPDTSTNYKHYEYYNVFQINITKLYYCHFTQPGEFHVTFGTKDLFNFFENFKKLFANKHKVSEIEAKRTTDTVVIGNIGKIKYYNITEDKWNKFTSAGALSEIEKLLLIWQNIYHKNGKKEAPLSSFQLEYANGELKLSLNERSYNSHRDGYKCIEKDFLIEHSELFVQTANQLCEIAKLL